MSTRLSRWATAMLVVAVILFMSDRSWAVYYGLGPSKDEWGLKYDVAVNDAGGDKVNVEFTLADEGRLKPFYTLEVIAFSKQPDEEGRFSYDVKEKIELKPTKDGKRVGVVQMRKDCLDRAKIRILTDYVDGKEQTAGLAYYTILVSKFVDKAPTATPIASPPPAKLTK
jgi:hypothetical protein